MKSKSNLFFFIAAITLVVIAAITPSCKHDPVQALQTKVDSISFKNQIQPIFTASCAIPDCHEGANPSAHLDLSAGVAYSQLFAKNEINITNPPSSFLYTAMTSVGTPMPPTGNLPDASLSLVLHWLQQGAKNN